MAQGIGHRQSQVNIVVCQENEAGKAGGEAGGPSGAGQEGRSEEARGSGGLAAAENGGDGGHAGWQHIYHLTRGMEEGRQGRDRVSKVTVLVDEVLEKQDPDNGRGHREGFRPESEGPRGPPGAWPHSFLQNIKQQMQKT